MIQIKQIFSQDHEIISNVFREINVLRNNYPNFNLWFSKVVRQLQSNNRKMYVALDSKKIAGVLILKHDKEESKICTLRVSTNYRGLGIGSFFMNIAISEFKTDKPFITVSGVHKDDFSGIFAKYGFEDPTEYPDYYYNGDCEYAYNGILTPKSSELNKVV